MHRKETTGVVVTNKHSTKDVIMRHTQLEGVVYDKDTFRFDFSMQEVTVDWGGRKLMTSEEAREFNADFGLWFSS